MIASELRTPEISRPRRRSARERWARLGGWLLVAVALALTWRLAAQISWRDLGVRVAAARWQWLGASLAFLVLRYFLWDARFRLGSERAVACCPHPGVGFSVLLASAALNLLTPSARVLGGPLRARYFARSIDRPFGKLYGVVLWDQLAHYAVMSTATVLSAVAFAGAIGRAVWGAALFFAWLALSIGFVVWVRRRSPQGSNASSGSLARFFAERAEKAAAADQARRGKLYGHGREAAETLSALLAARGLPWRALSLGAGFFGVSVLAQQAIFVALGRPVSLTTVTLVVALGSAAGMLTGTPGGVGTTEAAMVSAFVALGVGEVDAAAATLLFRGLHYASVLALGVPALVWLELKFGSRVKHAVSDGSVETVLAD